MSESDARVPGQNEPEPVTGTDQTSASADETASPQAEAAGAAAGPEPNQTLLEQMGGVRGLAYSAVPILVFILINSMFGLMPAIWTSVGVAVAIAVLRIVRKEPVQPAISGVIGVAVCAFIAYRSGDAKGFFLLGIWTNLIYGGAFLISLLARWPLVGVAWSALNGGGFGWRQQRKAIRGYDLATLAWVIVFAARYVIQQWLYAEDQTGWLAFARIAMGYPLAGLALLVTVWAIRRANRLAEEAAEVADAGPGSIRPSTG